MSYKYKIVDSTKTKILFSLENDSHEYTFGELSSFMNTAISNKENLYNGSNIYSIIYPKAVQTKEQTNNLIFLCNTESIKTNKFITKNSFNFKKENFYSSSNSWYFYDKYN